MLGRLRPNLPHLRDVHVVGDDVPAEYFDLRRFLDAPGGPPLDREAATGSWTWCAGAPIPAISKDCCSRPLRRTANACASGSARTLGRPARAKRSTWCARSAALPWTRLRRPATS
jgi:hypothetical protein